MLYVRTNNKAAYNLYKKIGFENFQTIPNFYYNEELPANRDAYEMHLIKGKKTEEKKDINKIKENQPKINYDELEFKNTNNNFFKYDNFFAFLDNIQNLKNDNNINNHFYEENIINKKNDDYIDYTNAKKNIKNNINKKY